MPPSMPKQQQDWATARPSITKPFEAMPMFEWKRDDKHWDDECLTLLCSFAPDSVKQLCTLGKKLSVKMLNEYCNTLRADLREHLNEQANLGYITADELIARLEAQGDSEGAGTASTLVLDVRDDVSALSLFTDRAGGHIKGSVHLPSSTLDDSQLDKVITQHLAAQQPPAVVVHCMLSQQRGLRAAQRLASRLAELKLDTPVLVLEGGYKKFSAAASSAPHLIDEA
ncbi:hypothetical protein QJQ45_028873 [Haematococcus lacustris]|nr:hypothetical protein QJQ45_028873 [Haematococcus lacustris]